MKKILFYNHTGQISGAERVLLMILERLDRSRLEPVVLCPASGRLMSMTTDLGIKTVGLDPLAARFTWRPDRLIRYVASFVRVIRAARAAVVKEAPDIIHANSIRAGLAMSAATVGLGMPVVWHAHDLLPRHPLSTMIRLFACASRRNRIVAISRAVAARFGGILLRWCHRRVPLTTILNAVDVKRFQPDSASRQEIRRALKVAEIDLLVGTVGQLTPRKGQHELIQAFAEVAFAIPNAMLLIVGEPLFNRDTDYAHSLIRVANSLGVTDRIRFLGPREDVPAIMRALDLLVVNSRVEPFGLTVVEAMASGTPVLATAVDGITEIVSHGEDGWLVQARDHDALVKAMLTLLRDDGLRAELGRKGRRQANARFSIERFLREVEEFYSAVLNGGRMPDQGSRDLEIRLDAMKSATFLGP